MHSEPLSVHSGDFVRAQIPVLLFQICAGEMNDDQERIVVVGGDACRWKGFADKLAALGIRYCIFSSA
jgi:hypothetical protein